VIELFSPGETERIVEDACRILETVGVLMEEGVGGRELEEAGAAVKEGRHLIPERAVREALDSAPSTVAVFDRSGDPCMDLVGDRVHFDPGSAAIHVLDAGQGKRRRGTARDIVDMVRLVDSLPHYAAQSTALVPGDVPEEIADRYRLYLALRYGRKPVVTGTFREDAFEPMHAMLTAVRGGEDELTARPLAIFDCCPSPPLRWSALTCRCLLDCARAGIPVQLVSMPMAGATSPVTLREAVVQHCAENLSGIVLVQQVRRGAPVIYGGAPAAFDMRHGTTPMGAVETMMICAGYSLVGKRLNLPTHAYLGLSDAKVPDYQAGMESGIGAVVAALAGINLVSGPGMLDYLLTQSPEKLVLDHEACGMALRLLRGIGIRPCDTVDLMRDLVLTGEFLSHGHTRKHWRKELSVASGLIDRDSYGDWESKGGKSAADRARDEVARLLGCCREDPLPPDTAAALEGIMAADARRFGMDALPV
jgi:trimethylamine--corrinoid protein Co-methyltransferase